MGLHFHLGPGEGAGGEHQVGHKAALLTGGDIFVTSLVPRLIGLPVHQDLHLRLLDGFARGGLDDAGQGQPVAGRRSGRGV